MKHLSVRMIGTVKKLQRDKELYKAIREAFYSAATISDR